MIILLLKKFKDFSMTFRDACEPFVTSLCDSPTGPLPPLNYQPVSL